MRSLWFLTIVLAGCGGQTVRVQEDVRQSASNYKCGAYAVRTGALTPDGEPVTIWRPCWNSGFETKVQFRPPTDRATVAKLAHVEQTQCIGLLPEDLDKSPFIHRNAIQDVVPQRVGTQVVGVHVVFKPVTALTASWMRRTIACNRARWRVLGRPPSYLPGDPTLDDHVEVVVHEVDKQLDVQILSDSAGAGQLCVQRAERLAPSEPTALR